MKDNEKLSKAFRDMPPKNALKAMLLGCLAMFLFFFGYLALGLWMWQYSAACWAGAIMFAGLLYLI